MHYSSCSFTLTWTHFCSSVCGAQLVFTSLPVNKTVVEGGDASFMCNATLNNTPTPIHWLLGGGEYNIINQTVQLNTTNISGVEHVVVTEPLGSPLILNNVSRSLDRLFVSCLGKNQQGGIDQDGPPAVLGVICKFLVILVGVSVHVYWLKSFLL